MPSQYPLKSNPYSDFYHYSLVLPVLKCPKRGIIQYVLLCAPAQHFVGEPHACCWLPPCVLFSYYYLGLGSPRPTVTLLSVRLSGLHPVTFEARLIPSLFFNRTSTAASTGPGARPQGETSHGPLTVSAFGGSTLGEQRGNLRPPPSTEKEGAET